MPPDITRILSDILGSIADHNAALAAGRIDVDTWQQLVARDVLVGHYAAMMAGRETDNLSRGARNQVLTTVAEQVDYLNRFADQIAATGWQDAYGARALLYGGSIKQSFWRGRTFGLDLDHYPGDGSTPCLSNCTCRLEIVWLDEEELDADVYWRLGATEEHCGTCPERAAQSPYRFREGKRV